METLFVEFMGQHLRSAVLVPDGMTVREQARNPRRKEDVRRTR
jgi:hypothetical protein